MAVAKHHVRVSDDEQFQCFLLQHQSLTCLKMSRSGVRPYKCTLCDKAFTQRCSLESHMKKIHSVMLKYAYKERRNKLYVCEECGHTAATQDELLLHLHTLHPDSPLLKGKAARKAGGVGGLMPGSPQEGDSDDTNGSIGQ